MATPLSPDRLVATLRAEGVHVVERPGWRQHNRNHKGPWGPVRGVMIHHTVTSGTSNTVSICERGYEGLPGPLCHGVIAKDGTVYLIGNGRANHAGRGDRDVLNAVIAERALPRANAADADGNPHFYGWECENLGNGRDPWPQAQLEAIERVATALCRVHGWSAASVIGHKEWQPGKVDPLGFTMDSLRERVAARLKGKPKLPPHPGKGSYTPPPFPKGLAPGRTSPSAKGLQQALKDTGWLDRSVPLANNYGPQTQKAVAAFNRKHNLYTTGRPHDPAIGRRGWDLLHRLAYGN
ncbi:N-acetylmuramoyl-L-alanine amidase [Streptomyces iakyrus]|uniref:peptidoglycan recognition protein family protein n=1 Tax=Streptomyces iakyrus TaxID=68219 RepID=UPI0033A70ED7